MDVELKWLQDLYKKQCDGDWEHQFGIKIDTLDNPGWSLRIDINNLGKDYADSSLGKINRSDVDWIVCRIENNTFIGFCGAENLTEALSIFENYMKLN